MHTEGLKYAHFQRNLTEREADTMERRVDKNVTKGAEGEVVEERRRAEGRKPSSSPEDFQTPPSSPLRKEEQNMEVDESVRKWGGGSFSEEDQHWGQQQVREE